MPRSRLAPDQCVSVSDYDRDRGHGHDRGQRALVPLHGSGRTRRIEPPEHGSLTGFPMSDENSWKSGGLGN